MNGGVYQGNLGRDERQDKIKTTAIKTERKREREEEEGGALTHRRNHTVTACPEV